MEILRVEDLSFKYPLMKEKTLSNISFSLQKGEFVVMCGATGSGKSTFLRMLKRELTPLGEKTGRVLFKNIPLEELDNKTSSCKIGFVMQNPEQQIVTDKVWHELSFGLENMNIKQDVIRRRVSEMSCYFGIEDWFSKDTNELSGGQKQLLNLASVMIMQPDLLILDEPTAQLDPIAASDFLTTVKKINQELSLTVLLAEHRLEEIVPICDRLVVIDKGEIIKNETPNEVIKDLRNYPELLMSMPAAVRFYNALDINDECPIDIRSGRKFIETHFKNDIKKLDREEYVHGSKKALEFSNVYFKYDKNLPDVLSGLSFSVYENEIFCILGGNGSGKTTTLKAACNINRIYGGTIKVFEKKLKEYKNQSLYKDCLAILPQDVQTVFLKSTVRDELNEVNADISSLPFDMTDIMDKHPYDLSGGEQQLVALAKILASKPKLLLLDEPSKGLDASSKFKIIDILKKLRETGVTIVVVTHDVDFASYLADRCAMFFKGDIVSCSVPNEFFFENSFYTTASNRMTRGYYDNVINVEELLLLCQKNGYINGYTGEKK